jgi:hypothetical protein
MTPDLQQLVADLQRALGLSVTCGQIVLNLNERRVQSYEVKEHFTVRKTEQQQQAGQR